jgi:hypothetical protein
VGLVNASPADQSISATLVGTGSLEAQAEPTAEERRAGHTVAWPVLEPFRRPRPPILLEGHIRIAFRLEGDLTTGSRLEARAIVPFALRGDLGTSKPLAGRVRGARLVASAKLATPLRAASSIRLQAATRPEAQPDVEEMVRAIIEDTALAMGRMPW